MPPQTNTYAVPIQARPTLGSIKHHTVAAFFLTSALASVLLMLFFALGTFSQSVTLDNLSHYQGDNFSLSIPKGMNYIKDSVPSTFAVANSPLASPVVISVEQQPVLEIVGMNPQELEAFAGRLRRDMDNALNSSLTESGFDVGAFSVSSFEHEDYDHALKYVADATNQDRMPVTVVAYTLVDPMGNLNFLTIMSAIDLKPTETNKADAIAESLEVY